MSTSRHNALRVLRHRLFALSAGALLILLGANLDAASIGSANPYAGQVQQMYVAYYGRPGDPEGVDYWAGRLAEVGGNWIADLVNAFGTSAEYTERFAELANETLIDNLYLQLFNRIAEPVGRSFYIDLLGGTNLSGLNPSLRRSTLAEIALDIANGALNQDALTLANKLEVAASFTTGIRATAHGYDSYDIPLAVRLMATVDDGQPSVTTADTYIDAFLAGIGSGTFRVGDDIAPGTYASLQDGGCYWARLSGFSGESADLIANDFVSQPGPGIVTIDPTDVGFESTRCGTWIADILPLALSPEAPRASGTYRVGRDMRAGTWIADNLDGGCYWERLEGFSGTFADILANDYMGDPGQVVVLIDSEDAGFYSSRCGIWTFWLEP